MYLILSVLLPNNNPSVAETRPVFCLLLGVSSDYAQPITGQVTEVTCPVIGQAQSELTPCKRQKTCPGGCTQIPRFMRPTWGPLGSCRSQMCPMLAHELCYQGSNCWILTSRMVGPFAMWVDSMFHVYSSSPHLVPHHKVRGDGTQAPPWYRSWTYSVEEKELTNWSRNKNCRHFADDRCKCISLNGHPCILFHCMIQSKIIQQVPVMAWHTTCYNPLHKPVMTQLGWMS